MSWNEEVRETMIYWVGNSPLEALLVAFGKIIAQVVTGILNSSTIGQFILFKGSGLYLRGQACI
jgi:hypothetical protein